MGSRGQWQADLEQRRRLCGLSRAATSAARTTPNRGSSTTIRATSPARRSRSRVPAFASFRARSRASTSRRSTSRFRASAIRGRARRSEAFLSPAKAPAHRPRHGRAHRALELQPALRSTSSSSFVTRPTSGTFRGARLAPIATRDAASARVVDVATYEFHYTGLDGYEYRTRVRYERAPDATRARPCDAFACTSSRLDPGPSSSR